MDTEVDALYVQAARTTLSDACSPVPAYTDFPRLNISPERAATQQLPRPRQPSSCVLHSTAPLPRPDVKDGSGLASVTSPQAAQPPCFFDNALSVRKSLSLA